MQVLFYQSSKIYTVVIHCQVCGMKQFADANNVPTEDRTFPNSWIRPWFLPFTYALNRSKTLFNSGLNLFLYYWEQLSYLILALKHFHLYLRSLSSSCTERNVEGGNIKEGSHLNFSLWRVARTELITSFNWTLRKMHNVRREHIESN